MSRFYLGYALRDDSEHVYNGFLREIERASGVTSPKIRIPHITIKAPFESEDLTDVRSALSAVVRSGDTSYFNAGVRLRTFPEGILFMPVTPSPSALTLIGRTYEALRTVPHMTFDPFDVPEKEWHVTLAKKRDMPSSYSSLIKTFEGKKVPRFLLPFTGLDLFKKTPEGTELVEHYAFPSK